MGKKERVLVVEDELTTQFFINHILSKDYEVIIAPTLDEAISNIKSQKGLSLFLVDLSLPDGSGYSVCQEIRNHAEYRNTPLIILTGNTNDEDRVLAYNLLADDFITKPVTARVLESLVRNRIAQASKNTSSELFLNGSNCIFDPQRHLLNILGTEIDLTPLEAKLLTAFTNNRGIILERNTLLNRAWGTDVNITDRVIDQHISTLRKKLENSGVKIETIYGVGYRLSA